MSLWASKVIQITTTTSIPRYDTPPGAMYDTMYVVTVRVLCFCSRRFYGSCYTQKRGAAATKYAIF